VQKTKTNPFLTVTRRYNMPGCAAGEIFAVVTLKMMLLLSFLASRAYARTPRKIHPRDFGFGPNYANFVIKIRISFSTGTDSEGWAPGPPLFFVFCSPLPEPALRPSRPLPLTPPGRPLNGRLKTLGLGGGVGGAFTGPLGSGRSVRSRWVGWRGGRRLGLRRLTTT
jgi:hypothetical protein